MKIATWNINSVRHRINLVTRFLREQQPDVLCLQETKVINELFPAEAPLAKLGYVHQAIHGQKAYHGVAVLSRLPFAKTGTQDFCREGHARHMGVTLRQWRGAAQFLCPGRRRHSRSGEERQIRPQAAFPGRRWRNSSPGAKPSARIPSCWSAISMSRRWRMMSGATSSLLDVVSHTPVETRLLGEAQAAFDWTDATRALHSAGRENLFLVELSRRGLGSLRSRPPAGSCLAQPRPQGRAQIADHREENARLAESVRSCAGDRGDRHLKLAFSATAPPAGMRKAASRAIPIFP